MLVTFGALAALFVVLDGAAGVHPPSPLLAAAPRTLGPTAAVRTGTPTVGSNPTPPDAPRTDAAQQTATAIIGARVTGGTPVARTPSVSATGVSPVAPASPTAPVAAPSQTITATDTATGAATPTSVTTTETVTPTSAVVTATETVTPAGTAPATGTVTGDTPPHYGALLNYTNNTQFSPAFMQALDEQIIALTNAQRAAHGLAPLSENGQLDIIAASRSQDQIKRQYFDHYDPTGPVDASGRHAAAVVELLARDGVTYTEVGENLINNIGAPLDASTPRGLVDSWMRHPEHRDNILHGSYTTIGVGMAAENESDGLHVVFTQVFVR